MATRKIHRLRSGRPFGKAIAANERFAAALVKQGTHGYADDEPALAYQAKVIQPEPAPAAASKAKRTYRRRDLKAEGE